MGAPANHCMEFTMVRSIVRFAGFSLLVLAAAACSKSADQQLIGTWALDGSGTAAAMTAAAAAEGSADPGMEFAIAMLSSMNISLTFAADNTFTANMTMGDMPPRTESGTWRVVSVEGNVVTIESTEPGEGSAAPETETIIVTMTDANSMSYRPADEEGPGAMLFERTE